MGREERGEEGMEKGGGGWGKRRGERRVGDGEGRGGRQQGEVEWMTGRGRNVSQVEEKGGRGGVEHSTS